MSQTQILQLSDIHMQCNDIFDYSMVLGPLIARLRKDREESGLHPELLIVSGDIAWSGKREEYELAITFLSEVCRELDIPEDAVFLVPGNHDVDRDKYLEAEKHESFPYDEMRKLNHDLENEIHRKQLFRGLDCYFDFIHEYYPHLDGTHGTLFPYVSTYPTSEEKRIALVGLNTAWLCRYSPDREKVAIGFYQVEMALRALADKKDFDLGIVCYHHPRTWLWKVDRQLFLRRINLYWERFQSKPILLSGHLHEEEAWGHESSTGSFLEFQSGSIYLGSDESWPQTYHYLTIDWEKQTITLDYRKFVADTGMWVIASEYGDDGKQTFSYVKPKESRLSSAASEPRPRPCAPSLRNQPSDFVDRERESKEIEGWLRDNESVQVIGPGGIGKTDLLTKIGHKVKDHFENRVIYIARTDQMSYASILNEIAVFLEVANLQSNDHQKVAEIKGILQGRRMLLILDNVIQKSQSVVMNLADIFCETASILFANRLVENIDLSGFRATRLEELNENDSITVLEKKGCLSLSSEERKQASEIYTLLSGLPLTMEIAGKTLAGQADGSPTCSPSDLAKWIREHGLDVLNSSQRIISVLEYTYEHLNDSERSFFAFLGVFKGESFSLPAVKGIWYGDDPERLLFKLGGLALVKKHADSYYIHPFVAQFAEEKLEKEPSARSQVTAKMIDYYQAFLARNHRDPDQFTAINREINNIQTAIRYAEDRADDAAIIAMVSDMSGYYGFLGQYGYWMEGIELNIKALEAARRQKKDSEAAAFSRNTGLFHYWLGNLKDAHHFFHQALDLYSLQDDIPGQIRSHNNLGYIEDDENMYASARKHYEDSLDLAQEIGNNRLIALGHHLVAVIDYHVKCYRDAREHMEKCLTINQELRQVTEEQGDTNGSKSVDAAVFRCKRRLAGIARMQARDSKSTAEREAFLEEAMLFIEEVLKVETSKRSIARARRQRGMIFEERGAEGDLDRALKDYEEALEKFSSIGNTKGVGAVSGNLASIWRKKKEYQKAVKCCKQSCEIAKQVRSRFGQALAYFQMGLIIQSSKNSAADLGLDQVPEKYVKKAIKILSDIGSPFAEDIEREWKSFLE